MGSQLPAPLNGHSPQVFGPCVLWPNGWMDEDAIWYASRPQPRPHCVKCVPSSPTKGAQQPPSCWPMSVVATVTHLSYCWALVYFFRTLIFRRTQKSRNNSPPGHHRTTLSGYIFATKAEAKERRSARRLPACRNVDDYYPNVHQHEMCFPPIDNIRAVWAMACKDRPNALPGQMSYKATKPRFSFYIYYFMLQYFSVYWCMLLLC